MENQNCDYYKNSKLQETKWILISTPFLFLLGSILHFAYNFTDNNIIIGFFTPINESIFEHTKLCLTPLLLWWTFYYIFKAKKYNIDKNRWFNASLYSILLGIISVPILYYSYTGIFGIKNLIIDITILFISLLFSQLLGSHLYKYSKPKSYQLSLIILTIIIIIFIIFTVSPPNLPIFID